MPRGRTASLPTEIPTPGWKDIALRVREELASDRVGLIAAGIAFYGLLALFPAITALVAVAGLVAEPQMVAAQIAQLRGLVPAQVVEIVTAQATEVAGSREGGLGLAALLGFGLAVYSASKGTASLIEGLNVAYDEEETRGFVALYATRLGLTFFIVLGIALGLAIPIALPVLTAFLNMGPFAETLAMLAACALLFLLAAAGLAVIYRFAPSRDNPEFAWVSPGALLACIAWIVASVGFAYYVRTFGTYNETFGTLAGVIVLLMWFWISAFIVLLGAEINAETEAQTRHDTTIGRDQPMGQRGAVKADQLGESPAG